MNPNTTKEVLFNLCSISYLLTSVVQKKLMLLKIIWQYKKKNKDILSSQVQKTFNFVNLTYAEIDTNQLLIRSLQKDILHINSTVNCLSKELKALFHDRNFFIIMFQLRSNLATLCNGINSVRSDILSILNQVSVISSQKPKPALINPSDLKSSLTKLENWLVSHPSLALPQWEGENI